jgi:hypothetical protein
MNLELINDIPALGEHISLITFIDTDTMVLAATNLLVTPPATGFFIAKLQQ